MTREDHYDEAERLLDSVGQGQEYVPMLLEALTHAVLASVDVTVAGAVRVRREAIDHHCDHDHHH
jgi:hypothetical protein